jgi:hypothetical protein
MRNAAAILEQARIRVLRNSMSGLQVCRLSVPGGE